MKYRGLVLALTFLAIVTGLITCSLAEGASGEPVAVSEGNVIIYGKPFIPQAAVARYGAAVDRHRDLLGQAKPVEAQVVFLQTGVTDGESATVLRCLRAKHIPYRPVSEAEVAAGVLTEKRFRVFYLPGGVPPGDAAMTQARTYAEQGGYVLTGQPIDNLSDDASGRTMRVSAQSSPTLADKIERFALGAGISRQAYARDSSGKELTSVALTLTETPDSYVLFAANQSDRHLKGVITALPCIIGKPRELLSDREIEGSRHAYLVEFRMDFAPGGIAILTGRKQRPGWEGSDDVFKAFKEATSKPYPSVRTYRKSATEIWAYDSRPEAGMGMHGMPPEHLDMVRKLGMRFVRHTMYWYLVENTPEQGVYDPNQIKYWDDLTALCKEKGIEVLVVVHGNPHGVSWGNRREGYKRFADFMSYMAKRYPSVRYWELWNEMDVGFTDLFAAGKPGLQGFEGGKCYAEMLKLAYPAIKKANPNAWVVFGGMGADINFAHGAYEGGARDCFDVMNIHTYGVPLSYAFLPRGIVLHNIMSHYGDADKPLWNTEFGISVENIVQAWGFPHDRGASDGESYDSAHLDAWRSCVELAQSSGIYQKYLGYQFVAGAEGGPEALRAPDYAEKYLPPGMTLDDYGYSLIRTDGKTPRPTYDWMLKERPNRSTEEEPVRTVDVTVKYEGYVPVDHKYAVKNGSLIIKGIKIDSLVPTRIMLKK